MYLLNAFSLQMIDLPSKVEFTELSKEEAQLLLSQNKVESAIGHQDTANILSRELGLEIPYNRIHVKLKKGDCAVVAQVTGGRLPEGATTLPEGIGIKYILASVEAAE